MIDRRLNVTLRQLRVLLAVADHGGFSAAGDAIGMTQPAVSQAIGALESTLGLRLLDRTTRAVTLTQAGAALAGPLRRVLDELQAVLGETQALATQAKGIVRIASAPTISAGLMPRCLSASAARWPQIELVLQDQVQRLALENLRRGDVDFGVLVEIDDAPDLVQQSILEESFLVVCRDGHALAQAASVRVKALEGEALVLLDHTSGSRPLIEQALHAHGIRPRVVQNVGNVNTAFRMVAEGIGVSIVPSLALPLPQGAHLRALPLQPAMTRHVVLAAARNRSLSPVAQRIWDLIAEVSQRDHGIAPRRVVPTKARRVRKR